MAKKKSKTLSVWTVGIQPRSGRLFVVTIRAESEPQAVAAVQEGIRDEAAPWTVKFCQIAQSWPAPLLRGSLQQEDEALAAKAGK